LFRRPKLANWGLANWLLSVSLAAAATDMPLWLNKKPLARGWQRL
jgi:hypothetical protein